MLAAFKESVENGKPLVKYAGGSAEGGTQITVSRNDSLNQMSTRFGVPASAILAANGPMASGRGLYLKHAKKIFPVNSWGKEVRSRLGSLTRSKFDRAPLLTALEDAGLGARLSGS